MAAKPQDMFSQEYAFRLERSIATKRSLVRGQPLNYIAQVKAATSAQALEGFARRVTAKPERSRTKLRASVSHRGVMSPRSLGTSGPPVRSKASPNNSPVT